MGCVFSSRSLNRQSRRHVQPSAHDSPAAISPRLTLDLSVPPADTNTSVPSPPSSPRIGSPLSSPSEHPSRSPRPPSPATPPYSSRSPSPCNTSPTPHSRRASRIALFRTPGLVAVVDAAVLPVLQTSAPTGPDLSRLLHLLRTAGYTMLPRRLLAAHVIDANPHSDLSPPVHVIPIVSGDETIASQVVVRVLSQEAEGVYLLGTGMTRTFAVVMKCPPVDIVRVARLAGCAVELWMTDPPSEMWQEEAAVQAPGLGKLMVGDLSTFARFLVAPTRTQPAAEIPGLPQLLPGVEVVRKTTEETGVGMMGNGVWEIDADGEINPWNGAAGSAAASGNSTGDGSRGNAQTAKVQGGVEHESSDGGGEQASGRRARRRRKGRNAERSREQYEQIEPAPSTGNTGAVGQVMLIDAVRDTGVEGDGSNGCADGGGEKRERCALREFCRSRKCEKVHSEEERKFLGKHSVEESLFLGKQRRCKEGDAQKCETLKTNGVCSFLHDDEHKFCAVCLGRHDDENGCGMERESVVDEKELEKLVKDGCVVRHKW